MAPVYDFRHVELDKIGRGKRIVKPPGGECSDIFGITNGVGPDSFTPRKTKNYMQSNIFTPDSPDSAFPNGSTPTTPGKVLDTQDRLFGFSGDEETPRRVVNRLRSSIFEEETRPKTTPARRHQMNPITGVGNGSSNGSLNGEHHGVNGNGCANGHTSPDSGRVRVPPGGKSSGIF